MYAAGVSEPAGGSRGPVWARPEPAGRRPRFSREQIASAALAIADAEGFAAVSMRRVAAELGAGTMSLYRYVDAKGELVALMADALAAEALVPGGELPGDWRAALGTIARRTRAAYLRHLWAVHALHGEAAAAKAGPMGPNGLRRFEQSLAALASAPFDTAGRLALLTIVDDYVFGHVLRAAELSARARAQADPAQAAASAGFVAGQLRSGQFPRLQALAQDPAAQSVIGEDELAQRFELGLQALIDGAFRAWAYPEQGFS
jgi:AcrR family transcriptional regulator